jgi:diaminopimelate epimerase
MLRIFNPDGSEAEKSGNGLRIFARYLWDQREVGPSPFAVATKGGVVRCEVRDQGQACSWRWARPASTASASR